MSIKNYNQALRAALLLGLQACSSNTEDRVDDDDTGTAAPLDAGVTRGVDARASPDAANERSADAQIGPPTSVASGPKGYIGLFGDQAIGVFDLSSKKVVKTLPVTAPDGLVITPDGKKVYVSSMDTGTVKVVDTASDTIVASVDVGAKPAGLAVTPDGRSVVVAVGGTDEVVIIDTKTDAVVRHVPVGQAHASCITKDGHYAYVGSQVLTAPAVVVVDLTQAEPPRSLAVDKAPRMLACETGKIYFTAIGLDAVEVLDPISGMLSAPIVSGGSPHDVRAGENNQTELVVSQTAGDLEFIDVASATVTARVATGKLAHWIAVSADRSRAYVTNEGDNSVSFVDLASRTITDTVPVGKAPRKMAIQF
jgi:YVTN family beta-propeller protein